MASGSSRLASNAATAAAGAVLRPNGSSTTRDLGLDGPELLGDDETVLGIGDDEKILEKVRGGDALGGPLQQRLLARERQQLLRVGLARQRPQPRPGAT